MTASVLKFPLYNLTNIPEALRKLADDIDRGETEAIRVVVILEPDKGIDYRAFGPEPFTVAHAAGLCFSAANRILQDT